MTGIFRQAASAATALALIGASATPAFAASEPRVFTPTSPWNLDYADESCALTRAFSNNGAEILFELRQYTPANNFELTLATKGRTMRSLTKEYRFSPDEPWRETVPMIASFKGGIRAAVFSTSLALKSERPSNWDKLTAHAAGISELEVRNFFWRHAKLEFDQFGPAMAAMQSCIDELLTHWDIDAEAHKSLSRRVTIKNPDKWISYVTRNYPQEAVQQGLEGLVRVRLSVSEQGSPTNCVIQRRFSNKLLDETACEGLMKYGRFEPALDQNGNPIASYYATQVVFKFR